MAFEAQSTADPVWQGSPQPTQQQAGQWKSLALLDCGSSPRQGLGCRMAGHGTGRAMSLTLL
eukprot:scaffold47139_cov42-Prasinocladus_malaysianus.AAC.1